MTSQPSPKFLFAGGGTGGHLFSGIAVAEELRRRYPDSQVLFVGTTYGLEKEIVPKYGFPIQFIQTSPLKGSGLLTRIKSLGKLPRAYFQSKKILRDFKPDVVLGIGGYASGPMTLAAHFCRIPTAIIEQNSIPGFTNRQLARFVDKIFISFENSKKYFPRLKTFFTGNPSRQFSIPGEHKHSGKFGVFLLGGSQGAHALNRAMVEALPYLKAKKDLLHFIHQTGINDYEVVRSAYEDGEFYAQVFPFLEDLGPHYAQTDLMICRAGAGTITELQNLGLPSILIPYPYAADDHQLHNAKAMVEADAAELILNQDLRGEVLAEKILHYLQNPDQLQTMRKQAKSMGKPQAAEEVLRICLKMM